MTAKLKGGLAAIAFVCGLILRAILAQAEEPSSKVVNVALIDSAIFNKDNQNRLCKNLDGRSVVDKAKLKSFLIIYPEERAPLALAAWFLASANKLYELTPAGLPTAEKFFNDDAYQIVCKKPKTEGGQGSASAPDPLTELAKKIVVRKAVSDLTKTADEITVANAATASYAKDKVAHTTTISTEGLVGLVLAGTGADKKPVLGRAAVVDEDRLFYWYRVTPYIFHKRFDLEPDNKNKKDVNYVTPGIASNVILVAPDRKTSLSAQLDASTTFDQEQDFATFYCFPPALACLRME